MRHARTSPCSGNCMQLCVKMGARAFARRRSSFSPPGEITIHPSKLAFQAGGRHRACRHRPCPRSQTRDPGQNCRAITVHRREATSCPHLLHRSVSSRRAYDLLPARAGRSSLKPRHRSSGPAARLPFRAMTRRLGLRPSRCQGTSRTLPGPRQASEPPTSPPEGAQEDLVGTVTLADARHPRRA